MDSAHVQHSSRFQPQGLRVQVALGMPHLAPARGSVHGLKQEAACSQERWKGCWASQLEGVLGFTAGRSVGPPRWTGCWALPLAGGTAPGHGCGSHVLECPWAMLWFGSVVHRHKDALSKIVSVHHLTKVPQSWGLLSAALHGNAPACTARTWPMAGAPGMVYRQGFAGAWQGELDSTRDHSFRGAIAFCQQESGELISLLASSSHVPVPEHPPV